MPKLPGGTKIAPEPAGAGLQPRVGKAPAAHGEGELPSPDETQQ